MVCMPGLGGRIKVDFDEFKKALSGMAKLRTIGITSFFYNRVV